MCQDLNRWIKVPGPYSEMEPSQEALYRTARFLCAGEATESECEETERRWRAVWPETLALAALPH